MKSCPSCGGILQRADAAVAVVMLPAVSRGWTYVQVQPRVVVACTSCEYVEEPSR